jgi:hypothetical protein
MAWKAEPAVPQSITEHIVQTVGRIPDLSGKQRASVVAAMTELSRNLHFIKCIMDQMPRASDHSEGTLPVR